MSQKRLSVGFIGTGFIGKFHIRSWVSVRDADINGIVDKNLNSANEAASLIKELQVGDPKIYSSVSEMVADPNFTRLEIMEEIVETIESGNGELIGVACEKPLGRNVKEAKKMLELVEQVNLLDGYL